ncbi:MAG TPA: phenol hydroxylase subunit [Rhodocyclaceae bacterium]
MFNPAKKFVRVTQLREDGFIEFDFAVGEAEIYVEMILPAMAFDEFCALNKVVFLDETTSVRIDENEALNWRLSDVNTKTINKPGGKSQA